MPACNVCSMPLAVTAADWLCASCAGALTVEAAGIPGACDDARETAMHACVFCGSVMRLLLLPTADGSGKRLCCWGCDAAGRMDHVCWTDDSYCRDCGGAAGGWDAGALLGAGSRG